MTVNTTNITSGPYSGNGVTTTFSYTFRIETKTQIEVYETDSDGVQTLLTVDTDYSVTGLGEDSGGTVTRVAGALPSGYSWYIRSNYQDTQVTDFDSQGGFFPDVHESAFDKLTFLIQQLNDELGRSLRLSPSDPNGELNTLPSLVANRFLRVNSTANGFDLFTGSGDPVSVEVPVESYDDFRNNTGGFTVGDYSDGQIIWFTDNDISGPFKLKTGATPADDGGIFIRSNVDTNRYVERVFKDSLNVRWYGATGDGVTDDAAALDTALAAAETNSVGSVFFPAGNYLTTASLTLRTGVSVRGVGLSSVILIGGNNTRAFKATTLENVTIEKLFFDGQKPNVGWETTNNFDFGIRLGESATSRSIKNILIQECTFKDIGLDGIYIENYSNVKIAKCDFVNCRRWGIVPQAEAHDAEFCSIEDCYFDCDFGTGPVGKEYPLGGVDSEPNSGELTNITFKNLRGKRNGMYMVGSGTYTYDAVIENVSVLGDFLYISNRVDVAVRNSTVRGTAGYLLVDTLNDSVPTKIKTMDLRFLDTGRNQAISADGRENLMPYDHGFEDYWNGSLSASGSGTSAGLVLREIDGQAVFLRDHQIGPTSGSYSTVRHTLSNTLNANDQVVLILEVERTDSNTATGNFLSVNIGVNFTRALQVDAGVSTLMFAWKATATEVNPFVSIGLSGTAGAQVNLLFRKIKLFFNPTEITKDTFKTLVRPYRKTELSFTGPSVSAANARQISFSGSASNIDTINDGYNGQVLSLYGASGGVAFTVRDASVGGGNIELQNNGTFVLQNGTSNNALSLVYDSGTSSWIQAS